MAEVQIERERKNPVQKALVLLLTHLRISQPEVSKEAEKIQSSVDDLFAPENQWTPPEPGPTTEQVERTVQRIVEQKLHDFRATLPQPIPGPAGPKGDKGDKGDKGEPGDTATSPTARAIDAAKGDHKK